MQALVPQLRIVPVWKVIMQRRGTWGGDERRDELEGCYLCKTRQVAFAVASLWPEPHLLGFHIVHLDGGNVRAEYRVVVLRPVMHPNQLDVEGSAEVHVGVDLEDVVR